MKFPCMAAPQINNARTHDFNAAQTARLYKWTAILFLSGVMVYAWPWLSGAYTLPWDAKAQAWPQIAFLSRSLHAGEWPLWTSNIYAGWPQIADPQSLIFSPPFLLLAWLDPALDFRAMDSTVFAMLAAGGLCLIAYFRDRRWHPAGALVAALAFACGGSAAWRIQHVGEVLSLCWFAMTLFLVQRSLHRHSILYGIAAGLTAAFMVLGRDQIALICIAILLCEVVDYWLNAPARWSRFRASFVPLSAGFITGACVIAIPLALTLALAQQSNRPEISLVAAGRGSLPPWSFLTLLVSNIFGTDGPMDLFWGPQNESVWGPADNVLARNMNALYMGALPMIALIITGLARLQLFRRESIGQLFIAAVILCYALGTYTPLFAVFYHIPGVDLYRRPADATFPLCALLAILAGYSVHRAMTERLSFLHGRSIIGVAVLMALWLIAVVIAWHFHRIEQAAMPLLIAFIALATSLYALALSVRIMTHMPLLCLTLLAVILTVDLRINNKPNESTALPPAVYDVLRFDSQNETLAILKDKLRVQNADRRDRVELAAIDFQWPNVSLVHNLDNDIGYNPLRLKLFEDVTHIPDQIAIPEQRLFSPLYPSYQSRMANLLGLRYIVTGVPIEVIDRQVDMSNITLIAHTKDAYIYENSKAFPRAFFVAGVVNANFDQMISTGQWPDADLSRTVILEDSAPVTAPADVRSYVRIISYANTDITIEVSSDHNGWLVLSDIWHPWWNADVDGSHVKIYRANVMFRAVPVTQGTHIIHFHFAPLQGMLRQFVH
jgi:hypothetical protein